jgi:hypothetical protein
MSQAEKPNITNRLSRRSALAGLAGAAAAGITPVIAGAAEVDPIFAVIAEHRAAAMAHWRALHAFGELPYGDPEYKAAHIVEREASGHANELLWEVLHTQPTTLAGMAALLDHVGQPEFIKVEERGTETVLSGPFAGADDECPLARAAREFPVRLAETLRGLIGGQA